MFALETLLAVVQQVSGTPYISGGDSPAGTDCSGLASFIANAASGRPVYGDRFNTGNQAAALRARGFQDGTAPNALVIGWNSGHTAVTLPDGTPVSSGEGGGVRIGGGGAYQPQFTHHMFLPMPPEGAPTDPGVVPVDINAPVPPPLPDPAIVPADNPDVPPPPPPGDPAIVAVGNTAPAPDPAVAPADNPMPEPLPPAPEGVPA